MILDMKFQHRILRRLVRITSSINNIREALEELADEPRLELDVIETEFQVMASECTLAISLLDQYGALLKEKENQ